MSMLTRLPQESLAQIASFLNASDRHSLSTSTNELERIFASTNDSVWFDIYNARINKRRRQQFDQTMHTKNKSNDHIKTPCNLMNLYDLTDDLVLFKKNDHDNKKKHIYTYPYTCIHEGNRNEKRNRPYVSQGKDKYTLHVAHANTYQMYHSKQSNIINAYKTDNPNDMITCMHVNEHHTRNDEMIALGFINGTVLFRQSNDSKFKKMKGHIGKINAVHISSKNGIIASAGHDKTIRLRRISNNNKKSTNFSSCVLRGHGTGVEFIKQLNEDYEYVTHGGQDKRVKMWDVHGQRCTSTIKFNESIFDILLCNNYQNEMYVVLNHSVQIIDTRCQDHIVCILSLPQHDDPNNDISAVDMRQNDKTIVVGIGGGAVGIWDTRGSWEARVLGWRNRWSSSSSCHSNRRVLKSVKIRGKNGIVAGGDANEILTFSIDGSHQDALIIDNRVQHHQHKTSFDAHNANDGICYIGEVDAADSSCEDLVVATQSGHVGMFHVSDTMIDWSAAMDLMSENKSLGLDSNKRFWPYGADSL